MSIEDLFYWFGERLVSGDTIHLPTWVPVFGVVIGLILSVIAWSLPKPPHHEKRFYFRWVIRYLDVYIGGSTALTIAIYFCAREWPVQTAAVGLGMLSLVMIAAGLWPNLMHFIAMELVYDAFGMRLVRALGAAVVFTGFAGAFYVHERPPAVVMIAFVAFIIGASYTAFRWRFFPYIDQ